VHTTKHAERDSIRATLKHSRIMADTKISPYSLPDLKNTTDDALGNYLRGIGFKQDNTKADVKLLVGYLAVIIAGATFVADYKLGWEATKGWTAVAVAAYAILNGVFTYWLWFVEAGLVFEGTKDGKKVCPSSRILLICASS
jgi:signal peptidase complex subunit 2